MKYKTGDKPGAGRYRCDNCGYVVRITSDAEALPACPNCGHHEFTNWKTDRTPGPAASPARCRPRRGRDDDENLCVRQESRGLVTGAAASDMPRTSDLHKRTRIAPSPHQTRE